MLEGFGAGLPVTPGIGVEAVVACATTGGVPMKRVEVGRARKVGVAGAGVVGSVHAVNPANRKIRAVRKARSSLGFIFASSSIDHVEPFASPERHDFMDAVEQIRTDYIP
jgi:hypothetical protein